MDTPFYKEKDWQKRLVFFLLMFGLFAALYILGEKVRSKHESGDLPKLYIQTPLEHIPTKQSPVDFYYSDGQVEIDAKATLKRRGGSTISHPKHSYTLKFDRPTALGGLPANKTWFLISGYIDKTHMRHKLSYDLFSAMRKENLAPQVEHVLLSYNTDQRGIYQLTQKLNAMTLGLNTADPEVMIFKEPPVFYNRKFAKTQEPDNYYQQKWPKIDSVDRTAVMDSLFSFVNYSSDSAFAANLANWLDMESIIDWHLLLLLTNNGDGITKNFYLYKLNGQTPFRVAPWDYDHSFGRDGDNTLNKMSSPLQPDSSVLFRRMRELPAMEFEARSQDRYRELRDSKLFAKEYFDVQIHKIQAELAPHLNANFQRWPVNGPFYHDQNNFAQEVAILREFIQLRLQQLDERFGYQAN